MSQPQEQQEHMYAPRESGVVGREQEVFLSLIRAASRLEAELNRLFRPYELTGATFTILRTLEESGKEGLSCGDIAEQLVAEVPDMTRLLDRLERLGYVTRERSREDRRMVKVSLTNKGADAVRSLKEPIRQFHHRQLGRLSEEKLGELKSALEEVMRKQ
jgi:DNA-binding MarR family transcriptional regulator